MANNCLISTAARNAALDAVLPPSSMPAVQGPVREIYDGSQPAGPGTAVTTQNKLVTLTFLG